MKVDYDFNEGTRTYTCQVCGYKHINCAYSRIIEDNEPFIEMEGFELHSTDRSDGWHPSHNTHTVYACPKCGVLQIRI